MVDNGRHSETERVLVDNEGLAILSLLKIQSGPLGNLGEPPFDGDEMNMHMPQNVLAETELRHLAATPLQMISPSGNAPIIGIYQDSLLGSYRFTRPNLKLSPRDAMNLLMMFTKVDVNTLRQSISSDDTISTFDILSQILSPMTLKYKTKLFEEDEDSSISNNVLEIRNGKYIRGQMEKSVLGASTKGIIHRICNDYGNMAASSFIDDLQNIITEYMKSSSFSVGISDLIANKKTQDSILQIISEKKREVLAVIDKVHLGIFENTTSATNMNEFETRVNNILNKATDLSGKEGRKSLSKENRFLMIVNSGSKGSLVNISQMISCLGQQNVDGKRIPYGFDNRTLPHYCKFDDSPNARGFIENSYISGLTAPELFFHAMGGRIGLIDTACKTSSTGYIQRRLIKGLEDAVVGYDMTVRNNKGKIIQFKYGDDAFDSTKVENQVIPLTGMTIEDIYMHYDIIGVNDEKSELLNIYEKGTVTRMRKQRTETVEKCKKYINQMLYAREELVKNVFRNKDDNSVKVPVAFQYIIANIQGQLSLNSNSTVDITPLEAFELIEHQYKVLESMHYAKPTGLFKILYYYYLSPKDLLINKRFHRKALQILLETVVLKYKQALVNPGEMVGVIAGQSIGEPTTQLTLNSVIYETEIVIRDQNKKIQKVQIGDFIQKQIAISEKIDYMEDKDTTYAELSHSNYYEVPSANEQGETVWRRIEAVTKHPVINEDGTDTMLKITTKGCREVIATKAKSFLQLVDGQIIGVNGDSLKVGDYLPVSKKTIEITGLCENTIIENTDKINYIKLLETIVYEISASENIFPNIIDGITVMEDRLQRMPDMLFDEIVSIEEVQNTTPYAYDLTVEDTRNFDIYNGICMRDTFHLAGVASKSNVTRGVPRIEEILRLTKNPKNPSLTIHLKPIDELDQEKAVNYAKMLDHTKLIDVVKSVQIYFDPIEDNTSIPEDRLLIEQFYEFERFVESCNTNGEEESEEQDTNGQKSKWVIRLEINEEALLDKNITMDDIHFAVTNGYPNEITCAYSDYNAGNLVFRIRMNSDVFKKKSGTADPLDQSDKIFFLKSFQDSLLQNVVLRGVTGIKNILPRKLQNMVVLEDGKYVKKDTWVLDTTGSNLLEILGNDMIDGNRTYCNDIKEVFDVLGIEAARQTIYNEFVDVMEFSDVYINYHHLSLLCDRMTLTKDMVPIFRSGILKDDVGPIAKATFEMHTEGFLNAARHGEFDSMCGVSANVMCGQYGKYGTNSFNILLDMKEMVKLQVEDLVIKDQEKEIEKQFGFSEEATGCSQNEIMIRNNISAIHAETEGICDDGYDMGF